MTDSGTKCAWVIHESKALQIHAYNNRRCLHVPRVPGSVKNPYNNTNSNNDADDILFSHYFSDKMKLSISCESSA